MANLGFINTEMSKYGAIEQGGVRPATRTRGTQDPKKQNRQAHVWTINFLNQ
jgi:hypothetical protein